MKTFGIAIVIFAGLIFGNLFLESKVVAESRALLETGMRAVEYIQKGDTDRAKTETEALKKRFSKEKNLRLSLSDHTKSENIALQLSEAEVLLAAGDLTGAEKCLRAFCFLLQNFQENMQLKWYNIL